MSVRLEVDAHAAAPVPAVWRELIAWEGQERWIPLTTVRVTGDRRTGVGVHVEALSGFWLGRLPLGLLDRFVVTGWTEPLGPEAGAVLEVLHLGPYFTGPGLFELEPSTDGGTSIHCVELFDLPGAPLTEAVARLAMPIMRSGFRQSLSSLAALAEASST